MPPQRVEALRFGFALAGAALVSSYLAVDPSAGPTNHFDITARDIGLEINVTRNYLRLQ